jgi:hypothetical protein
VQKRPFVFEQNRINFEYAPAEPLTTTRAEQDIH